MTTLYDMDDIERKNAHMEGEIKDAKRILEAYVREHSKYNAGIKCGCDACQQARAWLARSKQA